MEQIRFLELSTQSAYENMAIDEAIMREMKEGRSPPTLRFYRWNPSAVSIGTFQGMRDEVDIDFCKANGIDYIRRITGGGAVFHDYEGEITYSIILPRGHRLAPEDIIESYKILCSGIIKGIAALGLKSQFKPVNDIISGGKKISGNAQTRRHSCVLQHGTILLDLDVRTMFSILKVPAEKISDKMIEDAKDRVTSIRDLLERRVTMEELNQALMAGFSQALDLELNPGVLTNEEQERMKKLSTQKYSTDEWNFSR
jgi:lipoate-protein ligase A